MKTIGKHVLRVAKLVLTGLLLALLISKFHVSWASFFTTLRHPSMLLCGVFLSVICIPVISTNRWRTFLSLMGIREGMFSLWRIILVACFQGLVFPSTQGADVVRMYYLGRRHPDKIAGAMGSVLVERMLGLLVFCAIAICGLPLVLKYADMKWPIVCSVVGFAVLAVCGTALALSRRLHGLYAGRRPRELFLKKLVELLDATHAALVDFPYGKVLLSSIVLIGLFQICTILCVYFIFLAYGVNLPFYVHMALYPVVGIIAMMPVTIGGFGVREGAFAYFYALLGVPAEISVCVSVANYIVLTLLPAAIGAMFWCWDAMAGLLCFRKDG